MSKNVSGSAYWAVRGFCRCRHDVLVSNQAVADGRMRNVGNVLEFFGRLPASFPFPDA